MTFFSPSTIYILFPLFLSKTGSIFSNMTNKYLTRIQLQIGSVMQYRVLPGSWAGTPLSVEQSWLPRGVPPSRSEAWPGAPVGGYHHPPHAHTSCENGGGQVQRGGCLKMTRISSHSPSWDPALTSDCRCCLSPFSTVCACASWVRGCAFM